jgi:hypothetical protein
VAKEFDGKVLLVTSRFDGKSEITTLKKVSTRRLGGREFLVGEYALPEKPAYASWRGVSECIPMDRVERIQVFENLAQCDNVYRDNDPPDTIAPQGIEESKAKSSGKFSIPPTGIPERR